MRRIWMVMVCGGVLLGTTAAVAGEPVKGALPRAIGKAFQVPAPLQVPVAFWHDIYAKYDNDRIVLHDTEQLDIVYEVVDVADISRRTDLDPTTVEILRRERVREAKVRVRGALAHLHDRCNPLAGKGKSRSAAQQLPCPPETLLQQDLTPIERRIVQLFGQQDAPHRFAVAMQDDRLRSQTGQKDKFIAGIIASGRYLPTIEKIFKEQGVPWEITRLVFVESMFNLRAYSKAGASGIWQFMPGTARLHGLQRDALIDERNDPVAATHAAARLLRTDHAALGSWPLAINAYNAGRGRLQQAVVRLGTTNIGRIIHEFNHPGYGFASRNFYPEFLAALDVYEHYRQHFGDLLVEPPLAFEAIVTTAPVPIPELARLTDTPFDQFRALNPAYTESVFAGATLLPAGYTVKVPAKQGHRFLAAIDRISRELPRYGYYVVQKGETVPSIATKVGASIRDLRSLNGLRGTSLAPGQILRLPASVALGFGTGAATSSE